jgi:cell division protein FtsB
MDREFFHAREVTQLYASLSDAQAKIEALQAHIAALEAEVTALLLLSQDYLRQLQWARSSVWV